MYFCIEFRKILSKTNFQSFHLKWCAFTYTLTRCPYARVFSYANIVAQKSEEHSHNFVVYSEYDWPFLKTYKRVKWRSQLRLYNMWIFKVTLNLSTFKIKSLPASCKPAWIILHEFLKTVFIQLFIFHVKILMFFHVGFVFKRELATRSIAMEMGRFLSLEWAVRRAAILLATKPKTF